MIPRNISAATLVVLLAAAALAPADEGMWLFNNPPRKLLRERYKFEPSDAWLEHVQKASVRFNSGGSGSFVSPDGLVMTNHHVGLDTLQKISKAGKDYVKDGFYARAREDEVKAVDLELNVLMSIQDVTDRVNAAVKSDLSPQKAALARRAVMAEIEKEEHDKTGLRCNVITLYQGGQYHLYRYKRYTDVRLVFAPEQQTAFYGGDPDNFEYPRYDLDVCFFRVYEDDKPVKVEHYFKWSKHGADDGELVFVPGNPGRTDRLNTVADLNYQRDRAIPTILQFLYRTEVELAAWSARSDENARRAKRTLFSVQNSRKARDGGLAGLLDPSIMDKKVSAETKLRQSVADDPKLKDTADAWTNIEKAQKEIGRHARDYNMLEVGRGFQSQLFQIARTLVRAGEERAKPNPERLREFGEANLKSIELALFSSEPIYEDYETIMLASSLTWLAEQYGASNELVQKVLAGKSPQERASDLVRGTKLREVDLRKKLYQGGKDAVESSDDPMIALAKLIDPRARAAREIVEAQSEIKNQAYAQIARAKYALEGADTYPDATFTLRLAFGTVKGYEENGKQVPYETTFAGLYERAREHHNRPPFDLPRRWVEAKERVNPKTPFNFVCTADIIGGNSGSPVINRDAEVVGLIFDGNIQSLVLDFVYSEEQARAVSVHSQALVEALRHVYDASALADELTGSRSDSSTGEQK